jgi:uncharacterized cupin superfamily protein
MPEDETAPAASVLQDPTAHDDLDDWGPVSDMIEGQSHTDGTLLHKGPDGESECGIWECTPGHWECVVERDEFCHFLGGRATYYPEDGEAFEVREGTVAFFAEGWTGTCEVHDTVRKVYMCR